MSKELEEYNNQQAEDHYYHQEKMAYDLEDVSAQLRELEARHSELVEKVREYLKARNAEKTHPSSVERMDSRGEAESLAKKLAKLVEVK